MTSYTGWKSKSLEERKKELIEIWKTKIPSIDTTLKYSIWNVLSQTIGGAIWSLDVYQEWAADQTNILTADEDNLEIWGSIWGLQRKGATRCSGIAVFNVVSTSVTLSPGTTLRSESGYFVTTHTETTTSSKIYVRFESENLGFVDIKEGQEITIDSSFLTGIENPGYVFSVVRGEDQEDLTKYRVRLLHRISWPPQGGSKIDYESWALECGGVDRAWAISPYPGAVTVYVMNGGVIPTSAKVNEVFEYINQRKPLTTELYVKAPIGVYVPIEITDLYPDTTNTRSEIKSELSAFFATETAPGFPLRKNQIEILVANVVGKDGSFTITSPTSDIICSANEIPILGTIIFS